MNLSSSGNTVRDNLISGESTGVEISTDDNVVQGNQVGTDAAGSAAVANSVGVQIFGGDHNVIGGTGDGEGNVLSGNDHSGLMLSPLGVDPAELNDVKGNLIGTTRRGRRGLANGGGSGALGTRAGVVVSGPQTTRSAAPRPARATSSPPTRAPASTSTTPTATRSSATRSASTRPGR